MQKAKYRLFMFYFTLKFRLKAAKINVKPLCLGPKKEKSKIQNNFHSVPVFDKLTSPSGTNHLPPPKKKVCIPDWVIGFQHLFYFGWFISKHFLLVLTVIIWLEKVTARATVNTYLFVGASWIRVNNRKEWQKLYIVTYLFRFYTLYWGL